MLCNTVKQLFANDLSNSQFFLIDPKQERIEMKYEKPLDLYKEIKSLRSAALKRAVKSLKSDLSPADCNPIKNKSDSPVYHFDSK